MTTIELIDAAYPEQKGNGAFIHLIHCYFGLGTQTLFIDDSIKRKCIEERQKRMIDFLTIKLEIDLLCAK